MKHSIPHDLDLATAKNVTDKAFESYKAKFAEYNPTMTWTSATKAQAGFSVKGMNLKGEFELRPKDITIDLDVPFMLSMFKGKAIELIEREMKDWIGKAKAGQI